MEKGGKEGGSMKASSHLVPKDGKEGDGKRQGRWKAGVSPKPSSLRECNLSSP